MKKIIKGKKYDTDTAEHLASCSHGAKRDFAYYEEELYRKRTGEFFLYGYGHAASRYAVRVMGDFGPGEDIVPLTYDEAREWAERELSADEYEEIFGEVSEDEELVAVTVRVPASAKAALDREASKTGRSRGEIVADLLSGL